MGLKGLAPQCIHMMLYICTVTYKTVAMFDGYFHIEETNKNEIKWSKRVASQLLTKA